MTDADSNARGAAALVVSDTAASIDILRDMLQPEGYEILAASSGEQALEIAAKSLPDVVLLDVAMPDMDGFETCRRLKAAAATQHIPVLFITALTDTHDVVEGFRAGGADYIAKPVRQEEVRARVRTQLQMRHYVQALRDQAERFRAIVNNMVEGLVILETDGRIQFANPACHHMLGYPRDGLVGRPLTDLLEPPLMQEYRDYLAAHAQPERAQTDLQHGPREVSLRSHDGGTVSADLTVTPIFLRRPRFLGLLHDISLRKQSEQELWRMASVDPLTNIPNRRQFDTFFHREWLRTRRGGLPLTLLMLDVDHFKSYNDSLGHQAGDRCLQQVAAEINAHAKRSTDMAARYGGEEFVLLFGESDAEHGRQLAESVRARIEALRLPHPSSPVAAWVTVSVGVATMLPKQELTADHLLGAADKALYLAKREGRNQVRCAA
jgi:two-component system cell cycle response regulator